MPFPKKLLNEGEEIILDLRPHWWRLVKPVAITVLAIVAEVVVLSLKLHGTARIAYVPLAAVSIAAILWLVAAWLRWTNTQFLVTTDRLISRSGVLAKRGREIPLDRLNDISYHQSFFERIIGSGDLMIESAGEQGQEVFADVRRPSYVQNEIYRQIDAVKDRDAARHYTQRELSPLEQLEKLDELRQRGVISQAEFDAKKAQLLDKL
ncbi:MAG: hypothetical protein QOG64_874 [Acidimicrobiaceae bacterium]|nr:hypothetical protein [Acidimicrobiaceae bacterium]